MAEERAKKREQAERERIKKQKQAERERIKKQKQAEREKKWWYKIYRRITDE
jgi:hypothetical protein